MAGEEEKTKVLERLNKALENKIRLSALEAEDAAIWADEAESAIGIRQAQAEAEMTALQQQISMMQMSDKALASNIKNVQQRIEHLKEQGELDDKTKLALGAQIASMTEMLSIGQQARKNEAAELKLRLKGTTAIRDRAAALRGTADTLGELVGVSKQWKGTWVGVLVQVGKANQDGAQSFKELASAMAETFNLEDMAGSAMVAISEGFMAMVGAMFIMSAELFKSQDKAFAQLNKQTGQQNKFNDSVVATELEMRRYGVSTEEVGASYGALQAGSVAFRNADKATQQQMAKTVSELEHLGIASDKSVAAIQSLTQVFGETGPQAKQSVKDFYALAQATGLPPETIISEFPKAAGKLAIFGKNAKKVFESTARSVAAFGGSISETLDLVDKYDTFDEAASAAAGFNAIMRTNAIDSAALLKASYGPDGGPEAIQRLLVQGFERSGKTFAKLSGAEQKALAARTKLSVEELSRLPKTTAEFDKKMQASKKAAMEEEKWNDVMKDATGLFEQLAGLAKQFAQGLQPLLPIFKSIVGGITDIVVWLNKFVQVGGVSVLPVLALFAAAMLALVGVFMMAALFILPPLFSMVSSMTALGVAGPAAAAGAVEAGAAMGTAGNAAATGAPGMAAFGLATLKVGLGVLAIGAGVLLIGAGFALVIYSVVLLMHAFVELLPVLTQNMGAFVLFIALLYSFVSAMILMAATSFLIIPALFGIAAGFAAIGYAMMLMGTEKILAIGDMFSGMSLTIKAFAEVDEPGELTELMEAAAEYNITAAVAQLAVIAGPAERLVAAVAGAAGGPGGAGGAGGAGAAGGRQAQPRQIEIVLNERVLGRFIDDHLNGKYDPAKLSKE